MSIIITELLGKDPFSGSRITINANFQSIKTEVDTLEANLGISVSSGNIDISAATGGQLKAKAGAFNTLQLPVSGVPNITLTGSTGAITGSTLSLATSAAIPTITADNLTLSSLGQSIFNGGATFNALVKIKDGLAYNKVDVGVVNTHTVINSDRVILFTLNALSPGALVLVPDPSLVDGHIITLVDTSSVATTLDTTLIMGFSLGSITFATAGYKSSITLMWSLADGKWIIIESSNMTIL
jgi:hypothetical protein